MKCNEAVEFGECAYEFQSNSSAVGFNGLSICAPQKIWLRVLQLGHEKGVLMTGAPQLNLLVWVHICWDTREDALMVDRTKVCGF